jgi:hypothetical protein
MKARSSVSRSFYAGVILAVSFTTMVKGQEPIDPLPFPLINPNPTMPRFSAPLKIDTPAPSSPPIRIDPPIYTPSSVHALPAAGGGSPPPPLSQHTLVPILLPQPWDDEERYLEKLIQRYNGDEGLRNYLASVQKARGLWDAADTANELAFALTAVDSNREIAKLVIRRLEKEAVASVHRRLESQLAQLEANAYNWSETQAHRERALAEIRKQELWLNRVTQAALAEAGSRVNQSPTSHDPSTTEAHILISDSFFATTSHIQLQEGTAMRQLRDVASHGWSGVLNAGF